MQMTASRAFEGRVHVGKLLPLSERLPAREARIGRRRVSLKYAACRRMGRIRVRVRPERTRPVFPEHSLPAATGRGPD